MFQEDTYTRFSLQELRDSAKKMRNTPTRAEALLWQQLRARRLGGYKFRRQRVIGWFIADFCCLSERLVIEIDGEVHENQKAYDAFRSQLLSELGFRMLRFDNEQIFSDIEMVKRKILEYCRANNATKPLT